MHRRTAIAGGLAGLALGAPAPLYELRGYRAQPGRRDELIAMFEEVFLDEYQARGARIVGTFRSLDDPDRWVWMRAFADAAARGTALRGFYGGPVWKRHADACNATIADIDEAMLLHELAPAFLSTLVAPPKGAARPSSVVLVDVYPAAAARPGRDPDVVARLETDPAENTYPRQPVRADPVYVTLARFDSAAAAAAAPPTEANRMRLSPGARSALR